MTAVTSAGRLALTCTSAIALAYSGAALANGPCQGPGAPSSGFLECVTAISINGNPIRSFDISWSDPVRGLFFLGDRSNSGIDIIDARTNKWIANTGGFVGIVLNKAGTAVNNSLSGPDGVVSRGNWLYGGDGNSTLKVIDITDPVHPKIVASVSTGGTTRLDEMALSADNHFLLGANNAEDPPFATLFHPAGANTSIIGKVMADASVIPAGAGLSMEQPTWDPRIGKFLTSVPTIANNPKGCNYGQNPDPTAPITCSGAMFVIDPHDVQPNGTLIIKDACQPGKKNPSSCYVALKNCGPNGITIGPGHDVMLGCTPGNEPSNNGETIINDLTYQQVSTLGVTGSDEVWFDSGTDKYYTGSSKNPGQAVLGVVSAKSKYTIQTVPQSANSHSVAADSKRCHVFVPQVAPVSVVGTGGDTTTVGQNICGGTNGCVAVYQPRHDDDCDHDHDHH